MFVWLVLFITILLILTMILSLKRMKSTNSSLLSLFSSSKDPQQSADQKFADNIPDFDVSKILSDGDISNSLENSLNKLGKCPEDNKPPCKKGYHEDKNNSGQSCCYYHGEELDKVEELMKAAGTMAAISAVGAIGDKAVIATFKTIKNSPKIVSSLSTIVANPLKAKLYAKKGIKIIGGKVKIIKNAPRTTWIMTKSLGNKLVTKIAGKSAAKGGAAAGKVAAKGAIGTAAKLSASASKLATGVGAFLFVLDMANLVLDLYDPYNLSSFMNNDQIAEMKKNHQKAFDNAYKNEGAEDLLPMIIGPLSDKNAEEIEVIMDKYLEEAILFFIARITNIIKTKYSNLSEDQQRKLIFDQLIRIREGNLTEDEEISLYNKASSLACSGYGGKMIGENNLFNCTWKDRTSCSKNYDWNKNKKLLKKKEPEGYDYNYWTGSKCVSDPTRAFTKNICEQLKYNWDEKNNMCNPTRDQCRKYGFGVDRILDPKNGQGIYTCKESAAQKISGSVVGDTLTAAASFLSPENLAGYGFTPSTLPCKNGWEDGGAGFSMVCEKKCSSVDKNYEKQGALCKEKCKPGYSNKGQLTECYAECPTGWKGGETFAHCQHQCPSGTDEHDGLCYKNPDPSKYKYSSPGIYGGKCKKGERWDGTGCWVDAHSFGRGTGWASSIFTDANKNCEKDHGKGNCEKHGTFYYPKCPYLAKKKGYTGKYVEDGCCICGRRPQVYYPGIKSVIGKLPKEGKCPKGFTNIGIGGCQKPKYTRGTKTFLQHNYDKMKDFNRWLKTKPNTSTWKLKNVNKDKGGQKHNDKIVDAYVLALYNGTWTPKT